MDTIRISIPVPALLAHAAVATVQFPMRIAGALAGGVLTLVNWQERARARRQLAELDDRLLRDLGLTRGDVYKESRKHFWEA
jgi:uncharacterized protein YjiS (DUF1127 family)